MDYFVRWAVLCYLGLSRYFYRQFRKSTVKISQKYGFSREGVKKIREKTVHSALVGWLCRHYHYGPGKWIRENMWRFFYFDFFFFKKDFTAVYFFKDFMIQKVLMITLIWREFSYIFLNLIFA
jgi:hypothetical protein